MDDEVVGADLVEVNVVERALVLSVVPLGRPHPQSACRLAAVEVAPPVPVERKLWPGSGVMSQTRIRSFSKSSRVPTWTFRVMQAARSWSRLMFPPLQTSTIR